MQRDKTASQQPVVVTFTEPVRLMDINPAVEIVVCNVCGTAVPRLTVHTTLAEFQYTRMERPIPATVLHADWHAKVGA
jgi:hypothetical protein